MAPQLLLLATASVATDALTPSVTCRTAPEASTTSTPSSVTYASAARPSGSPLALKLTMRSALVCRRNFWGSIGKAEAILEGKGRGRGRVTRVLGSKRLD